MDGAAALPAGHRLPRRVGAAGGRATPRPLQLGFLCEYDALPGLGHACGHNLIAEVGAAAALGVKGALEGRPGPPPPVKVIVLGTPAEEEGGGKIDLMEAGALKILMLFLWLTHPKRMLLIYLMWRNMM